MSFRRWLNIATFVLIVVVLFLARDHIVQAWDLLLGANWWILLLLIPAQIFSYYTGGEVIFAYLRGRGKLIKTSRMDAAKMALELNFVNHVFPSGGIAGMSYMAWRLGKLGVPAGQATMAQIVRYVVTFATFIGLLAISLIFVTVDSKTSSWIVMVASTAITSIILLGLFASYLVGSERRMRSFARWLARSINKLVRQISFGRIDRDVLAVDKSERFFIDLHEDFIMLKNQKKMLTKPIIWSVASNVTAIIMFMITFWSLGYYVNPAVIIVAYGAASTAGLFVLTPGGAGAYEAIMVGILTAGGVTLSSAFAGVLLTRTILLVGTIATGFFFYHRALARYGKPKIKKDISAVDVVEEVAEDETTKPSLYAKIRNTKGSKSGDGGDKDEPDK